ncbi:MAG: ribonucleoside-diphosphate reductase, adenosylcobalamin-dependent [Verrucomicrobia bacterium SCN 57-15]|nr:MAG: ribonucleoside-diphosphate reductase, adenosylcobalamin-dependent [Verrucomicrobia bacterium SCN 57-15]
MNPQSVPRVFSKAGVDPFDEVRWDKRTAEITDDKNRVVFRQTDVLVPSFWSQLATNVVASKYFYGEQGTSERENSVQQLIHRVCRTIADWGIRDGYLSKEYGDVFYSELVWLCLHQYGAFNSPVWFNVGLHHLYGVGKNATRGNWFYNARTQQAERALTQYEYPQCSACFIQSVEDNMESIMDLAKSEAMLFKFGSGTGTDLTPLRSHREKLSGGGRPSGPLSFLQVYDQVAAIVKSGGKTRRAAKMNTLRDWHGDIEEFIKAKQEEEKKAWALIEQGYDGSFNGEAYGSVRFQNENLSVRASDEFMQAAVSGEEWWTRAVTTGERLERKDAASLLLKLAEGTWTCGDPGMQFDSTIQKWHTCKGTEQIHSTNPCSEYVFLNNTACNLASLNLMKFKRDDGTFDMEQFKAAVRLFITAQEILVDNSSYPTKEIAENSHIFRTLGLGFANLGSLIMSYGLPYDSDEARALAGAITAVLTGEAYKQSALLAAQLGAFRGYKDARCAQVEKPVSPDNVASMLGVIELHRAVVKDLHVSEKFDHLRQAAEQCWNEALALGRKNGFRNAQVTVLAPTGTISFLMDSDTTGIEPDIALVKYKLLAGGGMLKIVNRTVSEALRALAYLPEQIEHIIQHMGRYDTIEDVILAKDDEVVAQGLSQVGDVAKSGLKPEHLPVFDCAFKPARGQRSLSYRAHLKIMAAAQPFLSGAISKTVNVPNTATVEEIRDIYVEAWKMGLKCVAIYRDGSKCSQPLNTTKLTGNGEDKNLAQFAALQKEVEQLRKQVGQPVRRRMPETRASFTHKFSIAGHEGYFTVGLFEDGRPGELFITMAKEGSTIGGLMDTVATLVSLSLQYGVPLEDLVRKFAHQRFEPSGYTSNPQIRVAKSIVDYIFRWLGITFIPGYEGVEPESTPVSHLLRRRSDAVAQSRESTLVSAQLSANGTQQYEAEASAGGVRAMNASLAHYQSDAPPCHNCGAIMVRNGACYRCPSCGESSGCG